MSGIQNRNRNLLSEAVRYALFAGLATGVAGTGQAFAQDEDEDVAELERVEVTGSRIKRTDIEGPSPVVRYDREDLERTGLSNLQDFVRNLPFTTTQNFDTFANSFANSTSTLSLRGLGNQSTLVLINGRRVAPFGQGQNIVESFVDINSIPFSAIERIEILKDGASAIYGADAVAGVVNIILRSDYEGAEYTVEYQDTVAKEDASETSFSAIFGANGDDTSITWNFNYLKRNALFLRDRKFSENADQSARGGGDARSFFAHPGTVQFFGPDGVNSGVYEETLAAANCPETRVTTFVPDALTVCRYNYSAWINAFPSSETFNSNIFLDHELNSDHAVFGEFFFTRRNAINVAAPAPFTDNSGRVHDILLRNRGITNYDLANPGVFGGNVGLYFPAENPFNPYGEDVGLVTRPVAVGPRTGEQTLHAWRFVSGIEGSIFDFWDYEAALHYSRSDVLVENRNNIFRSDLQYALLGISPAVDGQGNPLWFNPFGGNRQEVIDYLNVTREDRDVTIDRGADFQLTGNLFELPAGPLGVAVGGEYREMFLRNENDVKRNRGDLVGTGSASDTFGERDQTSLFVEFRVPLLDTLEAQLAGRYEDYSDFGSTTNPKVGLRWQPVDDLLLRASWGESFRAPSLFELFNGVVTSFQGVLDPLRCPDGPSGENFATTTDIDCGNGQFRVENGGNQNLDPETAESFNFGVVWNPGFLEGFTTSIDLWKFNHDNLITQPTLNLLLTLNDPSIVHRADRTEADIAAGVPEGAGQITFIENTFINAGNQTTQGMDLEANYRWTTNDMGAFSVGGTISYYDEFVLTLPGLNDAGEIVDIETGGVGSTILGARPEWQARGQMNWQYGDHGATLTVIHRDEVDTATPDSRDGSTFTVDAFTTWDFQYRFTLSPTSSIAVGCINCLDEDPPFANNFFQGFLLDADDPRGGRVFARWTQQF